MAVHTRYARVQAAMLTLADFPAALDLFQRPLPHPSRRNLQILPISSRHARSHRASRPGHRHRGWRHLRPASVCLAAGRGHPHPARRHRCPGKKPALRQSRQTVPERLDFWKRRSRRRREKRPQRTPYLHRVRGRHPQCQPGDGRGRLRLAFQEIFRRPGARQPRTKRPRRSCRVVGAHRAAGRALGLAKREKRQQKLNLAGFTIGYPSTHISILLPCRRLPNLS